MGDALARYKGPATTDKTAYGLSNFVTPAPSFGAMGRVLAGQAYKGVKDNIDYYRGGDIHKAIGKLPKPKRGWTLPGHKYTGRYNPLEQQLKYNSKTGEILEIYDQPTGPTDATAMQHDVFVKMIENEKTKLTGKWFKP